MQRPTLVMGVSAALLLGAFAVLGFLPVDASAASRGRRALRMPQRPVATTTLRVRVVDGFGRSVAQAAVAGRSCDANGEAEARVARTPYCDLEVGAPGFAMQWLRVFPSSGEPLTAVLEPVASWDTPAQPPAALGPDLGEGFVVGPDRRPVEGAFVVVAETGARARTDAAGRYELPVQPGPNTVLAQWEGGGGEGFCARGEAAVPGDKGGRRPLPELVLAPAGTLRGVVRDSVGEPQPACIVTVEGRGFRRTLSCNEGGAFVVAGLTGGDYRVQALPHRGSPGGETIVRFDGTATSCEVRLVAPRPQRLRLRDRSGSPVREAVIASSLFGARRECAVVPSDGEVELQHVGPEVDFDVRVGAEHARLRVVARHDEDGELVVAAD